MAKRPTRVSKQDRISCLHDDILCHIISFLPIKEAFRTSTLSKRFANVFPLMSNLDFEDCFARRKREAVRAMDFVDKVLRLHNGAVDRLRLKCGEFVKSDKVDSWIRYGLKKKVKELDLWLNCKDQQPSDLYTLPIGVFTCETLVSLKLDVYEKCTFGLKLPAKVCLPRLKVLHLSGIKNSEDNEGDSIQRLVSSCSGLEELLVTRCVRQRKFSVCSRTLRRLTIANTWSSHDGYEIVIDAPSLVYFKCCYLPKRFLLNNLHSLVEADIELGTFFETSDSFDTYYEAATDLFRAISNVQTLRLSGVFGEHFPENRSVIPEFPKLTCLNLDVDFMVGWETVLPLLLACFPCIEALFLKVNHFSVKLPSKIFPFLPLAKLKTLQILSFQQNEVLMVKQLLKNAEVLEKLTLEIAAKKWKDPEERRSKITQKLLDLPKEVSKKCKVLVDFL